MRGGEVLQSAADMHPRTEDDVVVQCPIAGARNDDRMGKPLLQIERLGFAQIGKALPRLSTRRSSPSAVADAVTVAMSPS